MLDIVAALGWVKQNIHAFGGDPEKVTIFGESGGGAKVALLMAMPQAAGLFRAAIIESGVEPKPLEHSIAAERVNDFLAERGLTSADVDVLQALPAEALLSLGDGAPSENASASARLQAQVGPVADGQTLSTDPWREAPAGAAHIPLLMGHCAAEASLFLRESGDMSWEDLHARLVDDLRLDPEGLSPVVTAYQASYPGASASELFVRMISVAMFGAGMIEMADKKSTQPASVFYYRFEYDTGLSSSLGAFHTAELPLAMRMVLRPEAETLSQRIAAAWANFARTGDPNGQGVPTWLRYDVTSRRKMIFDREVRSNEPDREDEPSERLIELLRSSNAQH